MSAIGKMNCTPCINILNIKNQVLFLSIDCIMIQKTGFPTLPQEFPTLEVSVFQFTAEASAGFWAFFILFQVLGLGSMANAIFPQPVS